MNGMSQADKHELLFKYGINFNELSTWEKRGVGLYWEEYQKIGHNPVSAKDTVAARQRIRRDLELPMKDEYSQFIRELLD